MDAEFIYNGPGLGEHAHGASLVELHNGDLLAVWYTYPGHHDYQDGELALARKRPGQKKWSEGKTVFGKSHSSQGNPVLFQDLDTGVVWLLFVYLKGKYWNDAVLHSSYSLDNGYTWTQPSAAWPEPGLMVRHAPIVSREHGVLLPAYDEINNHSLLLRRESRDWVISDAFPDAPLIQPALVQEQSGRLTLLFRPTEEPRLVWRAHSNDGKSWSPLIKTVLPCPLSGVAGFTVGARLGIVYNHSEFKRYPLSISLSDDGGVTWSTPRHLDQSEHEVSYPCFMSDSEGNIHGVYTYNRRMIKYVKLTKQELLDVT